VSEENPTLKDIWRLLGTFNKRLDAHERQLIEIRDGLSAQIVALSTRFDSLAAQMAGGFGALKTSIEARDFRLDEHGRRLSELESKL
jgi:hypothetical protein